MISNDSSPGERTAVGRPLQTTDLLSVAEHCGNVMLRNADVVVENGATLAA